VDLAKVLSWTLTSLRKGKVTCFLETLESIFLQSNANCIKISDLNFYISVKVVNQTINFKDALVFNPCRSVDAENFREVYGDSYISGFIEGMLSIHRMLSKRRT
jgi:hypothetical protein